MQYCNYFTIALLQHHTEEVFKYYYCTHNNVLCYVETRGLQCSDKFSGTAHGCMYRLWSVLHGTQVHVPSSVWHGTQYKFRLRYNTQVYVPYTVRQQMYVLTLAQYSTFHRCMIQIQINNLFSLGTLRKMAIEKVKTRPTAKL